MAEAGGGRGGGGRAGGAGRGAQKGGESLVRAEDCQVAAYGAYCPEEWGAVRRIAAAAEGAGPIAVVAGPMSGFAAGTGADTGCPNTGLGLVEDSPVAAVGSLEVAGSLVVAGPGSLAGNGRRTGL